MITVDYSLVSYRMTGLAADTCSQCVVGLTTKLLQISGVADVDVTPEANRVNILTDGHVPEERVTDAFEDVAFDLIVDHTSHPLGGMPALS